EPEFGRGVEIGAEPERCVRSNADFLLGDALEPRAWHADALGQRIGLEAVRPHELLAQHLARMHRGQLVHGCAPPSVVVGNLNALGAAGLPYEANPNPVVHPDRMLPRTLLVEWMQLISGWAL